MLVLCMAFCQFTFVHAADKKSSKYSISMSKTVYTLKKGKSVTLKTKVPKTAKNKKVEWSSSKKSVATVSSKGKVTAKKNGKVKITARIKGTSAKAVCNLTVGTPVEKVKLNKSSIAIEKGVYYKVTAAVYPKKPTNKKVTFTSSNPSVATVTSSGVIKGIGKGNVKITAKAVDGTEKSASCSVKVEEKAIKEPGGNEEKPDTEKPDTEKPDANKPESIDPNPEKPVPERPVPDKPTPEKPTPEAPDEDKPNENLPEGTVEVKNQSQLEDALTDNTAISVLFATNKEVTVEVPAGDYTGKVLEINAPKSDVTNNGTFDKVIIHAIAADTYVENAENKIEYRASAGHIVVGSTGIATISLAETGGQKLHLENNGVVKELKVPAQSDITVNGTSREAVPVSLSSSAAGTMIRTSTELKIDSKAAGWEMVILPGGEHTKATVEDRSQVPAVYGLGRIPVTVRSQNDVVNVPAEMREDLGITQKVTVSGKVMEYIIENGTTKKQDSSDADIYLIPYNTGNLNMDASNADTNGMSIAGTTDSNGNYRLNNILIGNYWVLVKKDNFMSEVMNISITSNSGGIHSNGLITILQTEIYDSPRAASISGTVVNGLTGESVKTAGLQVKLRPGNGNIVGNEYTERTTTNAEGKFVFGEVPIPVGVYTIEVVDLRDPGLVSPVYNSGSVDIIVSPDYLSTNNYNCVVNPQMSTEEGHDQVQFTLTWGTQESGASADIDSHLWGPKSGGGDEFHVWFGNKVYGENDQQTADLDVDDTTYEGPEHTTIYKETDGIYRFYVHNYSEYVMQEDIDEGLAIADMTMLSKSSIKVQITVGNNTYVYDCPNELGNLWYVCDYDSTTGRIIPKNEVSTNIGTGETAKTH